MSKPLPPMMDPLLIWLLAIPGALLVLPLLSVACGRWMRGVSRAFGLLTGGACCLVVMALMFFRADTLGWSEIQFGVDLPWSVFPLLSVAIGVAT